MLIFFIFHYGDIVKMHFSSSLKSLPLSTLLFTLFIGIIGANTVIAQTCDEANLLACDHITTENCRAANSCDGDRSFGLTQQDIVEDVADTCCSRSTANKIQRCLRKQRRRLNRSRRLVVNILKPFLREAREGVTELRLNGCSTGSLGAL